MQAVNASNPNPDPDLNPNPNPSQASLKDMPGMGGQGLSMMSGSDLDLGDGKVNEEDVLKDEV